MDNERQDLSDDELCRMHFRDLLQTLTGGRPFIFVVMSFDDRWDVYERIKKVADEQFEMACVRADELKSGGHDLLDKIHFLIERADFAVAEISRRSPNVYYEVGYTVASRDRPLLLVESTSEVPADMRGLEVVDTAATREACTHWKPTWAPT